MGFVLGVFGTLIGAGGGFILVPLLLLLYPKENPDLITAISLAVVFANTLSGSLAYGAMKRIDYKSGITFSAATIPGAILGALGTAYVPRRLFDVIFGTLMIAGSAFLLLRPTHPYTREDNGNKQWTHTVVEADGTTHTFSYNPALGVGLSLFVPLINDTPLVNHLAIMGCFGFNIGRRLEGDHLYINRKSPNQQIIWVGC